MIQCKDYFIFKIRKHADEKIMKEWRASGNAGFPSQFYERIDKYRDFYFGFVGKRTGKTELDWYAKFPIGTRECLHEHMQEHYDILMYDDSWVTFLIPLKHIELIEWVKNNHEDLPYKELKKTHLGAWSYENGPTTIHREMAENFKNRINQRIKEQNESR